MSAAIYQPQTHPVAKVRRRLARHLAKQTILPKLERGCISFSFDDCPRSVVENALPQIEAKGWHATIYAALGLCDTTNHLGLHMSEADLLAAHAAGHEIADHTFSHMDAMKAGPSACIKDIQRTQDGFVRLGLPPATTFAYPYGEVTPAIKRQVGVLFDLARGIHDPSGPSVDLHLAASARLYSSSISSVLDQIDLAAREKRWLILFGHDVRDKPSEFGCTSEDLARVIDAVASHDLDVLPVATALNRVST